MHRSVQIKSGASHRPNDPYRVHKLAGMLGSMSELAGFSLLLVDDHPLFREGLTLALAQHEPQMRVQAVGSMAEALDLLARQGIEQQVDLALLDYRLPGDDGLQCALKLRKLYPAVACAIMSGADDARLPTRVREAGLMGYFPKTLDVRMLLAGLQELAQGRSHFAPLSFTPASDASADPLTARQREVLGMVARGATNKEIAQILQIAPHTVKNHLGQIFERLGAANRAQAVVMAQDATAPGSL
jgi:two-component system, NarL family, nitrate/nitrite response regulator NarL